MKEKDDDEDVEEEDVDVKMTMAMARRKMMTMKFIIVSPAKQCPDSLPLPRPRSSNLQNHFHPQNLFHRQHLHQHSAESSISVST